VRGGGEGQAVKLLRGDGRARQAHVLTYIDVIYSQDTVVLLSADSQ
jgi:hypothetical protein